MRICEVMHSFIPFGWRVLLPPQGFGPEAKTRGGILGCPRVNTNMIFGECRLYAG